jgi:UDP-3-O-[3-hydroxymyristoyl] glucosamine N-acyltransferase
MSTFDFNDGNGPVPAHRHENGRGWVADTASVDASAFVGDRARVYGDAWVCDNAQVCGDAWVCDNAQVYGNAQVCGNARVCDDARVGGNAQVYGITRSDGYTFIYVQCDDGPMRVIAGCRYFTMGEARKHWEATRGGTQLGRETMAILDALEAISKARDGGAV